MKLAEVKSKMLLSLVDLANSNGYKINKSRFCLTQRTKEKETGLYFTENHWFDEVQLMPLVGCNLYEINKTLLDAGDLTQEKYPFRVFFINIKELRDWNELGKVDWEKFNRNDEDKYFILEHSMNEDIDKASLEIQELFEDYAIEYLNKYSSVEGINDLYNKEIEVDSPHIAGFHWRSVVGLVAAKLCGNENYKEVSEKYTSIIHDIKTEMDEEDVERFLKVKKYLG